MLGLVKETDLDPSGDTFPVLLIKAIHKWFGKCLGTEAVWETYEMEHQLLASAPHPPKRTHWKRGAHTSVFSMINLTVSL